MPVKELPFGGQCLSTVIINVKQLSNLRETSAQGVTLYRIDKIKTMFKEKKCKQICINRGLSAKGM